VADLRYYGIHPRKINGLWGVVFSPFLHANLQHLSANTGALIVLLTVSLAYSRKLTLMACIGICLFGGGLVWLLGAANSVHIGASGLIFGLIGFLLFQGLFRKEWKGIVFSVAVFFLYGGALTQLLVHEPGVSWSGHVFGFLSGVMTAWWTRNGKR
jgi:membrane associated rhomboid family serine protease